MDEVMRPLTVVIVTFNSGAVIGDCLRSVRAELDDGSGRVVLVDNASTDDTIALAAAADPRVEIVRMGDNLGFAAGVNAGMNVDRDADVLVLNPDIELVPGSISALRRTLQIPGVGIAVPRLLDMNGTVHSSLRREPTVLRSLGESILGGRRAGRFAPLGELVRDPDGYRRPGTADWATGAAWLVSRDCVDAIGTMDERYLLYSEETEYMLRARDAGYRLHIEPTAEAIHRGGEQSTSSRLWALSVANRVRLHRERKGPRAGQLMRIAVGINELIRTVGRSGPDRARHRAALTELVHMRRWPRPLGDEHPEPDGYLCFSAQDWWYHNQAHSDFQLMRSLAARNRVLVVNSIGMRLPLPSRSTQPLRRVARKLQSVAKLIRRPIPELPEFFVMSPLPLPFYGWSVTRRINAALVRTQVQVACSLLGLKDRVVVVTIPTAWDVVQPMRKRALIYNRSDLHSSFPGSNTAVIRRLETELLTHSDHVLYVSESLMEEERHVTHDRSYFLDHGVDAEHFRWRPTDEQPTDITEIPGPRVGFFGALDDMVVDFALLDLLAVELPAVSLVLIGSSTHDMDDLTKHANVHWLGFKPYDKIPSYGSAFDVAIMPWKQNHWIQHSNPIKLKEYLALGLQVVSTHFAEVDKYVDRVHLARNPTDFVETVRSVLAGGQTIPAETLRASVRRDSWTARATELSQLAAEPGRNHDSSPERARGKG